MHFISLSRVFLDQILQNQLCGPLTLNTLGHMMVMRTKIAAGILGVCQAPCQEYHVTFSFYIYHNQQDCSCFRGNQVFAQVDNFSKVTPLVLGRAETETRICVVPEPVRSLSTARFLWPLPHSEIYSFCAFYLTRKEESNTYVYPHQGLSGCYLLESPTNL